MDGYLDVGADPSIAARSDAAANRFAACVAHLPVGAMREADDELRGTVPEGSLLDVLGIRLTHIGRGAARATMRIEAHHLNQAGVAQAGAIVALADATAGWAAKAALHGSTSFTTLELNANVLRAVTAGQTVQATAAPVHLGRSTMVLAVEVHLVDPVTGEPGRTVSVFRCTEMVIG